MGQAKYDLGFVLSALTPGRRLLPSDYLPQLGLKEPSSQPRDLTQIHVKATLGKNSQTEVGVRARACVSVCTCVGVARQGEFGFVPGWVQPISWCGFAPADSGQWGKASPSLRVKVGVFGFKIPLGFHQGKAKRGLRTSSGITRKLVRLSDSIPAPLGWPFSKLLWGFACTLECKKHAPDDAKTRPAIPPTFLYMVSN